MFDLVVGIAAELTPVWELGIYLLGRKESSTQYSHYARLNSKVSHDDRLKDGGRFIFSNNMHFGKALELTPGGETETAFAW
jgi:hypothetical protein